MNQNEGIDELLVSLEAINSEIMVENLANDIMDAEDLEDCVDVKEINEITEIKKGGNYIWNVENNCYQLEYESVAVETSSKKEIPPKISVKIVPLQPMLQRTNRIDAHSCRKNYRPGSYFDQYILERAWKHLGGARLFSEIRIPTRFLLPNLVPQQNTELALTSYQIGNGAYISPVHYKPDGSFTLGSWYGLGNNKDFVTNPIQAIEIFRLPDWDQSEYSLDIYFSNETHIISTALPSEKIENIKSCGIEYLSSEGIRIIL